MIVSPHSLHMRIHYVMITGDVDGCAVQPISQSQFTPLPEALCWVIWELNLAERSSSLEDVTNSLSDAFPDLVAPTHKVVYDTLGKLIRERKVLDFSFQNFYSLTARAHLGDSGFGKHFGWSGLPWQWFDRKVFTRTDERYGQQ